MLKNFPVLVILLLVVNILGCKSSSKEDTYGWWKPETQSAFNNREIFISENTFRDNREHKILKWENSEKGFLMSCDIGTLLMKIDEKGYLIIKPQVEYAREFIYSRTTEADVKKANEERDKNFKKLTTSTPDPF